ncbi:myosin regulatory light chain 2, skeletal muscle isoform [Arapaima gigas]
MAPKKAKRRQQTEGGSSNVFSMFEQSQIQEYKEAFTIIDQNRDGIISKDDVKDVLASLGQLNVKNEELEAMMKEASGPINFTVFLQMFGEKLKGADPEDVIVSAFKVLDPEGTGTIKKSFLEELLTTQCDRFSAEEIKNLWAAFPPDVAGNVDYKNICYVITHGESKEEHTDTPAFTLPLKDWSPALSHQVYHHSSSLYIKGPHDSTANQFYLLFEWCTLYCESGKWRAAD